MCWIIRSQCVLTANHLNNRELDCVFVLFHQGPSCTAVKLQHAPPSPDQKMSLQWWHTRYNKQLTDSEGEVWRGPEWSEENTNCQSLWAACRLHQAWAGVMPEFIVAAMTDVSTERSSALQWLLTKQLFDQPLFWQRSLLSKSSSFSFLLLRWGAVDLFLQCPSPCLVFLSSSFWFLQQRVFGLQLLDTSIALTERPVVYCISGPQH